METAMDVLGDYDSPCGTLTLTFEDDGKVAYAYLKQGGVIVGDVWIYNRCMTPDEPEWKDRAKLPFANSRAYTSKEAHVRKLVTFDDVRVEWRDADPYPVACVYLFGDLVATVGVGDKPGYSVFAAKDGPLAKRLAVE